MLNFEDTCLLMEKHGMKIPQSTLQLCIPQAREVLMQGLSYFLKQENKPPIWLPEYEEVASWLSDNKGKGLLLFGQCGRGKSLLVRYVLPAILLRHAHKVTTVLDMQQLNTNIDWALSKYILSIDDVGTEEVSVKYGERRLAFAEVMDAVEKDNKLVLISTNLSANTIRARYGERVLDRIKATTVRVLFEGYSLRDTKA